MAENTAPKEWDIVLYEEMTGILIPDPLQDGEKELIFVSFNDRGDTIRTDWCQNDPEFFDSAKLLSPNARDYSDEMRIIILAIKAVFNR